MGDEQHSLASEQRLSFSSAGPHDQGVALR
jgi:hypothetical protein